MTRTGLSADLRGISELAERLRARRPEIERAVMARVYAVADPGEVGDPRYVEGLREAVRTTLGRGIEALGKRRNADSVPSKLTDQARQAARNGVAMDVVLRRYYAGYTLLCEYLIQEAFDRESMTETALRRALRSEAELLDRILTAVTTAYTDELRERMRSGDKRRIEQVRGLLAGDTVETDELPYEFDCWHLGAVAAGPDTPRILREIAATFERRLLVIRPGGETVWFWLGGRLRLDAERVLQAAGSLPEGAVLAFGEPAKGLPGWRATHLQAVAALSVAALARERAVRYADVALLAAALRDRVLAASLHDLYVVPLSRGRDGGQSLRCTARAYFEAGRNISATAAALKVSRTTVTARLRTIEERIGRPPDACAAEIEIALQLQELGGGEPGLFHHLP